MKELILLLVVAIALLVMDRAFRIEGYQDWSWVRDWFGLGRKIQRCGVDLAPCPHPARCINGFCRSEDVPLFDDRNPLPVLP